MVKKNNKGLIFYKIDDFLEKLKNTNPDDTYGESDIIQILINAVTGCTSYDTVKNLKLSNNGVSCVKQIIPTKIEIINTEQIDTQTTKHSQNINERLVKLENKLENTITRLNELGRKYDELKKISNNDHRIKFGFGSR